MTESLCNEERLITRGDGEGGGGLRVSALHFPQKAETSGAPLLFNLASLSVFDLQAPGTRRAARLAHPSRRRRHGDVNIQINQRRAAGAEHDTN